MSAKSNIEWTDATWNPVVGCTKVSPGCKHCYAEKLHEQRRKAFDLGKEMPYQYHTPFDYIQTLAERLDAPLRWRKPRRIFVNSMSDLFHEDVPDDFIAQVFAVMGRARWHTFQVLTKRAKRMRELLNSEDFADLVDACDSMLLEDEDSPIGPGRGWDALNRRTDDERAKPGADLNAGPLPNVWLGVSVEDQKRADERIPELLRTPAAVRFISAEPLLGAVDLCGFLRSAPSPLSPPAGGGENSRVTRGASPLTPRPSPLHWVICGGESGPDARPMHPDWARGLRDQCEAAGVPFFFEQWGEWIPKSQHGEVWKGEWGLLTAKGDWFDQTTPWNGRDDQDGEALMRRVGKARAGRILDGFLHDGMPGITFKGAPVSWHSAPFPLPPSREGKGDGARAKA